MANARLTPNVESSDMPAYLLVGRGKYYSASPQRAQTAIKHGKKLFTEKNFGVSGDAPKTFITPNTMINYSKERYDRYDDFGIRKGSKEELRPKENELLPNNISQIQTFHIKNQFSPERASPSHAETKKRLKSPVAEGSILEQDDYKDIYNIAFQSSDKVFHRKHGYFMDYTRKNKILLDQYTDDHKSTMHTRYISKPVIFTNLQTKNNLSVNSTNDHSKLLITLSDAFKSHSMIKNRPKSRYNTRQTETPINQTRSNNQTPLNLMKLVESSGELNIDDIRRVSPFLGDSMMAELKINSPGLSQAFTFKQQSPDQGSKNDTIQELQLIGPPTLGGEVGYHIEPLYTKSSKGSQNKKRPVSVSPVSNIKRTRSGKSKSIYVNIQDGNITHTITPEKYLKHDSSTENKINSKVLSEYVQENSKLNRTNMGTTVNNFNPEPWRTKQFQPPKESTTQDQIHEFEKRIKDLSAFNARLGKQRWCYDIDWKYNN